MRMKRRLEDNAMMRQRVANQAQEREKPRARHQGCSLLACIVRYLQRIPSQISVRFKASVDGRDKSQLVLSGDLKAATAAGVFRLRDRRPFRRSVPLCYICATRIC